jgi:integrase
MAVHDRWHRDPQPGDKPCGCGRGRNRLYPSAAHGNGRRWQVRWDDPNSATRKQKKKNFALRDPGPGELSDPDRHASAFDKAIQGSIVSRNYTDPNAGNVLLRDYAETWRRTRGHSEQSAGLLAARLRNHVYEDPKRPDSGRAPRGALSIGQHSLSTLAQRPTLGAAWVTSLKKPLPAERSRRQVFDDVSAILEAAVQDGIIGRNPLKNPVVDAPGRDGPKAKPFTAAELDAIAAELPPRLRVLPRLGAGTGAREMELAALGVHDFQFLGKNPRVTVERQLKKIDGSMVFSPIKNRKPHSLPLAAPVAGALQDHLRDHPALEVTLPWHEPGSKRHGEMVTVRLVLQSAAGGPLTRAALVGAWTSAAARAVKSARKDRFHHRVVTGQNVHRLRHTYASAQLRAGVDVVRVAAWMGDTVDMIVKTYAHLMPDDDGDADGRAAVEAFFGTAPGDSAGAPGVPPEAVGGTSAQVADA